MTWNNRVIKDKAGRYGIHEVYYGIGWEITGSTEKSMVSKEDSIETLIHYMKKYQLALDKPILDHNHEEIEMEEETKGISIAEKMFTEKSSHLGLDYINDLSTDSDGDITVEYDTGEQHEASVYFKSLEHIIRLREICNKLLEEK